MDHNCWWLGVYKDNKRVAFNIIATQEGIMTELVENGLKTKIVKLKK